MSKKSLTALALIASMAGFAFGQEDPTLATSEDTQYTAPSEETSSTGNGYGVFGNLTVGTLGLGIDLGYQFNDYIKVRFHTAFAKLNYDFTWSEDEVGSYGYQLSEINAEASYNGRHYGILVDYHPFKGTFHLTGGVNISDMYLQVKANLEGGGYNYGAMFSGKEYKLGDHTYRINPEFTGDVELKARYEWKRVQPYFGLGWSSGAGKDRDFYFSFDMGVNIMGKGTLKISHSGDSVVQEKIGNDWADVQDIDSELESAIREEGKDVFDIADKIIVYPVIQLGFGFRF